MSRFRLSAVLAVSVAVVAVMLLRRDRRQPVVQASVPTPAPAPVPEEPVATPLAEEAPVEQPADEETRVEEAPVEEAPVEEAHDIPVAEPAVEVEVPPAPLPQLYPETDGVPSATPEPGYWHVPTAPPVHWSEPSQLDERRSA